MSNLSIQLHWHRTTPDLKPGAYSAEHTVQYTGSFDLLADAAPDWGGDPANTNPRYWSDGQISQDPIVRGYGGGI